MELLPKVRRLDLEFLLDWQFSDEIERILTDQRCLIESQNLPTIWGEFIVILFDSLTELVQLFILFDVEQLLVDCGQN